MNPLITKMSLFSGRCTHVIPSLVLEVIPNCTDPLAAQLPVSDRIQESPKIPGLFLKYKSQCLQQSIRNHGSLRVLNSHAREAQHFVLHPWEGRLVVLPCGMAQQLVLAGWIVTRV